MVSPSQIECLSDAAWVVRDSAYAPYSNFQVGSALLAASGKIYTGANVENLSFGLTVCAERSALVAAISAGERRFSCIVIAADTSTPITPCGSCRQMLSEFGTDLEVISITKSDSTRRRTLESLLPEAGEGILDKTPTS